MTAESFRSGSAIPGRNKRIPGRKIKVFLEEGKTIHYSYEIEELKENCIVVKDLRVDEMSIVTIVE